MTNAKIDHLVIEMFKEVSPSFSVAVASGGKTKYQIEGAYTTQGRFKKSNPKYYDLASLTKPFFTNTLFLILFLDGALSPKDKVRKFLPWFEGSLTIKDLLFHSTGLPPVVDLFKDGCKKPDLKNNSLLLMQLKTLSKKARPNSSPVYSDVNYLILGEILKSHFNQSLYRIWNNYFDKLELFFNPKVIKNNLLIDPYVKGGISHDVQEKVIREGSNPNKFRATEVCPQRNCTIQGEVNDLTTWLLGGVSTHAGLFGDMDGVLDWFSRFRKLYKNNDYVQKLLKQEKADWSYGFMRPSEGYTSAGEYFPKSSLGHLAFTGCSWWWDPKTDFSVIVLSNRTMPSVKNTNIKTLRPKLHDLLWQHFQ